MQDPSQGVAQQLQNHVHLISAHQFPLVAQLHVEQAFRYLIDAPVIVKSTAPMSWTYVNMPGNGTIWLEWLSPSRQHHLASDGYIWGDPESTQRIETQGYTVEIMRHNLGYRPGLDPIASHARTRYHFIQKAPHVPAAAPDPSLWIVHYHQAQNDHILPVQQIPVQPQARQIMHERQVLQSQGRLEKRDFMLHDREHWPHINGPTVGQNMMAPGFYGSNPMPLGQQSRYSQAQYTQYQGQQPPNKRPRTGTLTGPGAAEMPDTSVEDEENTALGDFFDHLTPRDISMARYQQHHRWMEEVFSSPYATGQIVPADLGLGLMGELKPLTEGILEPPTTDFAAPIDKSGKPQEAPAFTNLSKDQVDEFNKRVQKHLEDGQAEIERMKADHAAKMQDWRKTKTLLQAEKRLRFATWEGHEAATPIYRLDEPAINGQPAPASKDTVEDVVKDVETLLGVKFTEHKVCTLIDKGGLEEKEEVPQTDEQTMHANQQSGLQPGGMDYRPSASPVPQSNPSYLPPSVPQLSRSPMPQQQQQQYQQPSQQQVQPQPNAPSTQLQMPEGMDIDPTDFNFDSPGAASATTAAAQIASTAVPQPQQMQQQQQQQQSSYNPAPTTTQAMDLNINPAQDSLPDPLQDDSMFADSFNDFTTGGLGDDDGNGDGGVDGLIDFDAGVDGLEDSAFGDALHGMDDGDGDGEMFGAGGA